MVKFLTSLHFHRKLLKRCILSRVVEGVNFPEDPAVGAEGFAFGGGEGSGGEVVDGT
jgi:hypothetical protein